MDAASARLGLDAVADAVLHQGLQQQRRHSDMGERIRQVERAVQAPSHADLHERQIVA
ncbi:hypothetical protein D3C81_2250490 [compost metagenome]